MIQYISNIRDWYDSRQIREKLLVLGLGWAFLYAIFSFVLFQPLNRKKEMLTAEINEIQNQINNWNTQITALKKIPHSALYKEWAKHRQSMNKLQNQYKFFLQQSPSQQWETVMKTILQPPNNITLVEVKNLPESPYTPASIAADSAKIYQQQLVIIFYSNFYDTLDYIDYLEKKLPNVHWDSLNYEVAQYPVAKVQVEFSIIYEKL